LSRDQALAPALPAPARRERTRPFARFVEQTFFFWMLTTLGAQIAVPLPPDGVPMTFQSLAVLLAALSVGAAPGAAAMGLYLLTGVVGAAVFAGGAGGVEALLGQSGGYLVGFILCQPVVASIARRRGGEIRGWGAVTLATLAGSGVIFAIGVPWLAIVRGFDLARALEGGLYPFIPGLIVKSVLAVLIAKRVAPYAMRKIW